MKTYFCEGDIVVDRNDIDREGRIVCERRYKGDFLSVYNEYDILWNGDKFIDTVKDFEIILKIKVK